MPIAVVNPIYLNDLSTIDVQTLFKCLEERLALETEVAKGVSCNENRLSIDHLLCHSTENEIVQYLTKEELVQFVPSHDEEEQEPLNYQI